MVHVEKYWFGYCIYQNGYFVGMRKTKAGAENFANGLRFAPKAKKQGRCPKTGRFVKCEN